MDGEDPDDLRVLDQAEAELEDIERAMRRLDDGSYALCEVCGGRIADDRLASSPVTRRCAGHGPATDAPAAPGA